MSAPPESSTARTPPPRSLPRSSWDRNRPAESLSAYPGVRRRQSVLMDEGGMKVIEDYAHHPAEIRAVLTSIRGAVPQGGRMIAVFQPHRHSRTAQFKAEFAASLALADSVHLMDVYSAGEEPVSGGTTADIYAEIGRGAPLLKVSYLPGASKAFFSSLLRDSGAGDIVVFVGAGDIDQRAREWIAEVRKAAEFVKENGTVSEGGGPASLKDRHTCARDVALAEKTTMRVGGAARLYAEPTTENDLSTLLVEARRALGAPCSCLAEAPTLSSPTRGWRA